MNIEQEVKQSIKEFGKEAYKRFNVLSVDSDCPHAYMANALDNNDVVRNLSYKNHVKLKTLRELFQHDVKFYGADAYLMYRYYGYKALQHGGKEEGWHDATSNSVVSLCNTGMPIRRKTSAALQIDIERAIAGDAVELLHDSQWITVKLMYSDGDDELIRFSQIDENGKVISTGLYLKRNLSNEWLRMKYPKAAK